MDLLKEFDDEIHSFSQFLNRLIFKPLLTFRYIQKSLFTKYVVVILLAQVICYFIGNLDLLYFTNKFSSLFYNISVLNFIATAFSFVLQVFFLRLFLLFSKRKIEYQYFTTIVYCTVPLMLYQFVVMLVSVPFKLIGVNFMTFSSELGFIHFLFYFWVWYLMYCAFGDLFKDRTKLVIAIITSILLSVGLSYSLFTKTDLSRLIN